MGQNPGIMINKENSQKFLSIIKYKCSDWLINVNILSYNIKQNAQVISLQHDEFLQMNISMYLGPWWLSRISPAPEKYRLLQWLSYPKVSTILIFEFYISEIRQYSLSVFGSNYVYKIPLFKCIWEWYALGEHVFVFWWMECSIHVC